MWLMEGDCKLLDDRMLSPQHERNWEITNTTSIRSVLCYSLLVDYELEQDLINCTTGYKR